MIAFLSATFLSAFLLFQVQPIIARYILPLYGGSPSLWTASMMFFQLALLAGYLYAHLLTRHVPEHRQPAIHLVTRTPPIYGIKVPRSPSQKLSVLERLNSIRWKWSHTV